MGPPPEVDWNAAWNEVLHVWNERVSNFIANAHVNTWSYITCKNYWNLARHVAALPANRWVQRLLSWHILLVVVAWAVHDILGNPNFMRIAGAQIWDHGEKWMTSCGTHIYLHLSISAACKQQLCTYCAFCACALKRARHWRAGLTWPDLTWPCCGRGLGQRSSKWSYMSGCLRAASTEPTRAYAVEPRQIPRNHLSFSYQFVSCILVFLLHCWHCWLCCASPSRNTKMETYKWNLM